LAQTVVRVGAFPNITHAQAMVGKANRSFDKALGSGARVQWITFNAGPSAITVDKLHTGAFKGVLDQAAKPSFPLSHTYNGTFHITS
jgi:ABC-type nitrate/sulfonate/bicarbonate transport system substrate-binding protein